MTAPLHWLPWLLQTSDALFPTGAYAHSLGFEESVRLGVVRDEATLREFLLTQIVPAQREQELPYLRFAFDAAVQASGRPLAQASSLRLSDDHKLEACATLETLCAIDQEISAWKLARETRQASVQLGVRRLAALRTISASPLLSNLQEDIDAGHADGHHLVVCAAQAVAENVPLSAALAAFYYQSLGAVCAAALKLIRIGQDGCQRVLREGCSHADETLVRSMEVQRERAGWFNPMLEIAGMRHEHAHERLFIS